MTAPKYRPGSIGHGLVERLKTNAVVERALASGYHGLRVPRVLIPFCVMREARKARERRASA